MRSPVLETRIPPAYRDAGGHWYGLSLRARVIVHSRSMRQEPPASYLDLAHPRWRGQLCMRSSNNAYNQSLVAALLGRYGEARTLTWLEGLVANFARPPQGGDRDQVRAVAAGLCKLAVVNSYYLGGMLNASLDSDVRAAREVVLLWAGPARSRCARQLCRCGCTAPCPTHGTSPGPAGVSCRG